MMNIYLAGPLFSLAEQQFNSLLYDVLIRDGYKVFLPQKECKGLTGAAIFETCKNGINSADIIIALLEGADADSGTCWECGYAFAGKKHIIAVRTDFRNSGDTGGFNAMLYYSANKIIDSPNYLSEIRGYLAAIIM
jgi:nucleoside 2-deoxyribosyltransferase